MAYKLTLTIIDDRIYATVIKNSGDECYIIPNEDNRLYTKMEVCLGDQWAVIGEEAALLRKNSELSDNYSFSLDLDKLYQQEDENQIIVITEEKEINWTRESILAIMIKKIILNAKNHLHTQFFESIAFNLPELNLTIKSIFLKAMSYLDFNLENVHFFQFHDAIQTFIQVHLNKRVENPSLLIHTSFDKTYIIILSQLDGPTVKALNLGVKNLIEVINTDTNNGKIPKAYKNQFLKKYFVDKNPRTDFLVPYFSKNDITLLKPDEKRLKEIAKMIVNDIEKHSSQMLISDKYDLAVDTIYFSGTITSLPAFQELFYKKYDNFKVTFLEDSKKNVLPYGAAYHHNLTKNEFAKSEFKDTEKLQKLGLLIVSNNYNYLKIIPVSEKMDFPLSKRIIVKTSRNNQKKMSLIFAKYNDDISDAVPVAQIMTHINENIPLHSKITINFSINYKGEMSVKAQNFTKRNNYSTNLEYTNLHSDSLSASIKESIRKLKII